QKHATLREQINTSSASVERLLSALLRSNQRALDALGQLEAQEEVWHESLEQQYKLLGQQVNSLMDNKVLVR
ncbi:MAG: hypothetical protein V3V61_01395, partial [Gammaproteobacteria bacterium]